MRTKYILIFLFLSACQVGPRYQPPITHVPDDWKHEVQQEPTAEEVCGWWEVFNDEMLNALIESALESNNDLYAALERVAQARALAGEARSALYPQLSLGPTYSNQIYLTKIYAPINQTSCANQMPGVNAMKRDPFFREHLLTYTLPLNLSWEIDLWGQLYSNYQSAVYYAQAQEDAFQNALLVLTTDLANSYFRMRTFDTQIDLYRRTIVTRKKALELNQARYDAKIIYYQAVSQATLDLSNVEADYYEALRQRDIEEDRIAVLIGMPSSELHLDHNPLNAGPPVIPVGLPSEVLMQRPDIAQAERVRASQQAQVRVAYAAFFPSFTLTGALGFSSPDLKHFLTWRSRWWEIGANVFQTVFDAGLRSSQLDYAIAVYAEADFAYKQHVLVAFQEVEDSLASIEWFYKEAEKLAISVKAATTTYKIAYDRYYQGVNFYLDVVDSERDQLNAERNYISVLGSRYIATIQFIKSIGGSW